MAVTFKEGDKVRQLKDCSGAVKGEIYELVYGNKNGELKHRLWAWKGGRCDQSGCCCEENWELVEPVETKKIIHCPTQELKGEVMLDKADEPSWYYQASGWKPFEVQYNQLTNKPKQKTFMNTLTNKIKRLFSPAKQTLYKAGYLNDCGDLTNEGWEELRSVLVEKYEAELVKLAEEKIKEQKENKE